MALIDTLNSCHERFSGKPPWFIDSGATSHMTGDMSLVDDFRYINPIAINLPNGKQVWTNKEGIVRLGEILKLSKVLVVLRLNCNLMLVWRLCKELNCYVTFDENYCILQDHTRGIPIGVGEQ